MKTDKNILIAFLLNLLFAIIEFIGGILTNSVAIISDAVHDVGDSISIGMACFLEKKSLKKANKQYTYGYIRYSVLGSLITTLILISGAILVMYNAVKRIINPVEVKYNGMMLIALFGVIINYIASYFTHKGHSLNQKAVNLHMLEDTLGWAVVLIGAIIMKFTNIFIVDPILSIIVSTYIFIHAFKNLKQVIDIFMEKVPDKIDIEDIKQTLKCIPGVEDIHHIHVWSLDGYKNYATMHVVVNENYEFVKKEIKEKLEKQDIFHVTIEMENSKEHCVNEECNTQKEDVHSHTH